MKHRPIYLSDVERVPTLFAPTTTTKMWRDVDASGSHLLDSVAIAVQRCSGMAVRASVEREARGVWRAGSVRR